jgi:hypothetical protein
LTAKAVGVPLSTSEINQVILSYLDIVDGKSIANTLTDLNANYENVTGVLPPNDAPAIAKVFKSGGQTSTFSIPNYDTIRFGKDTIAITYPDPARDNNLTVELRNLNGSLLQKVETPHPVYYDFRNIENRCIFLTENKVFDPMEGAIIYYRNLYLISKNEVKSVAIVSPDTASVRDILNDFAWWND